MQEEQQNPAYVYITGRIDKMLVPTLLYQLAQKPAHGYELIQKINESGFSEIEADPATIYRNLRRMEEDGLSSPIGKPSTPVLPDGLTS